MNLSLTRFGPQPGVEIARAAHDRKGMLLAFAGAVAAVGNPEEQVTAVDCLRDIKGLKKEIEQSRVAIKAPVLTLGRDIDSASAAFCAELDSEDKRLTGLVSRYQEEQRRIAAEAEAARQRELQRIENERLAAEREAQRIATEELRKARSLQAADEAAARAEAQRAQAAQAASMARAAVFMTPAPVAPVVEGMHTRKVPKFDVIDVRVLASARPDLVRIEANAQSINKEILAGNLNIAGLKCWVETGVRV